MTTHTSREIDTNKKYKQKKKNSIYFSSRFKHIKQTLTLKFFLIK
jgi:hypothetical protein